MQALHVIYKSAEADISVTCLTQFTARFEDRFVQMIEDKSPLVQVRMCSVLVECCR